MSVLLVLAKVKHSSKTLIWSYGRLNSSYVSQYDQFQGLRSEVTICLRLKKFARLVKRTKNRSVIKLKINKNKEYKNKIKMNL
jgi:hypothetical protein